MNLSEKDELLTFIKELKSDPDFNFFDSDKIEDKILHLYWKSVSEPGIVSSDDNPLPIGICYKGTLSDDKHLYTPDDDHDAYIAFGGDHWAYIPKKKTNL